MLAERGALLFAQELHFENLVMEGDSEIIINAIKGDNLNLSNYGHLLQDIKVVFGTGKCFKISRNIERFILLVANHTRESNAKSI